MRKKQICYNGRKYGEKEQKVHADIRRGIDETTKNAKARHKFAEPSRVYNFRA